MGVLDFVGKVLGTSSDYEAKERNIDDAAFDDETLGANKKKWAEAEAARLAQGTPVSTSAQLGPQSVADAATISTTPQSQFRNAQGAVLGNLMDRASGKVPGLGEMLSRRATDRAIQTAKAISAGARGNAGLAMRQAQRAGGQALVEGNAMAAETAAREQQAAENAAAGLSGQARAQDIGLAEAQAQLNQQATLTNTGMANQMNMTQAQLDQQTSLANQSAELAAQQQRDQMVQYYTSLGYSADQAQFAADQRLEEMKQNQHMGIQGAAQAQSQANAASNTAMLGAVVGAGATAMTSDKRVKKDVTSAEDPMDSFLSHLVAKKYQYKDQKEYPEGDQFGIMAQDLEKSEVGKTMVSEEDGVKRVTQSPGVLLAALARLNERITELEGKKRGKN